MDHYKTQFFVKGPITLHDGTLYAGCRNISISGAGERAHEAQVTIFIPDELAEAFSRACAAFNAAMRDPFADMRAELTAEKNIALSDPDDPDF